MYADKREQRRKNAQEHIEYMEKLFSSEIQYSLKNTIVFADQVDDTDINYLDKVRIELVDLDTVSALFEWTDINDTVAILNFASYKNPGGGFINGSIAQEESLCHYSSLYHVLREQTDYYEWNKNHLNHALYTNRALYSPMICFIKNDLGKLANVMTCAAPNIGAARRYQITDKENYDALKSRIQFVLDIASKMRNDTLILGAYGCGVFGQNPRNVANIFIDFLQNEYANKFKKVIFAIPRMNAKDIANYDAFAAVINEKR